MFVLSKGHLVTLLSAFQVLLKKQADIVTQKLQAELDGPDVN